MGPAVSKLHTSFGSIYEKGVRVGYLFDDCSGAKSSSGATTCGGPDQNSSAQVKDGIRSIEFAPNGETSRKVVGRSNARPTGRYPSHRMKRMIQWDSPYELYAYRLLDIDFGVLEFREQPCVIHYCLAGQNQRHFPDIFIRTRDAKMLLEVKTSGEASRPEISSRTKFLINELPAYGYQYSIVLAEDLRREPRLKNARLVLRLGRSSLTLEQREFARRLFEAAPSLRWGDLQSGHFSPLGIEQCCRLVLEGVLRLNLDDPIGPDTKVVRTIPGELMGCSIV